MPHQYTGLGSPTALSLLYPGAIPFKSIVMPPYTFSNTLLDQILRFFPPCLSTSVLEPEHIVQLTQADLTVINTMILKTSLTGYEVLCLKISNLT